MKVIRICRTTTVPFAMIQLKSQMEYLSNHGFSVTMVSSKDDGLMEKVETIHSLFRLNENLSYTTIEIPRDINLFKDFLSVLRLVFFFRKNRFDIVHSMTPKAGLVTALAGVLARVPVRLHSFTGQTWLFKKGVVRFVTKGADWLVGLLNTQCYADSKSQTFFLSEQKVIPFEKIRVILEGSIAGIDLARFDPTKLAHFRVENRKKLTIPDTSFAFVYVGRKTKEKGIVELVEAFKMAYAKNSSLILVLIGPVDNDAGLQSTFDEISSHPGIRDLGFVDVIEEQMIVGDAFCLPSYREGFSGVVLQAAALCLPILGTDVNGINDFVTHEKEGLLVEPRDPQSLAACMLRMSSRVDETAAMGQRAREKVVQYFDSDVVNAAFANEYRTLLNKV
jgi:glycosyltransferase involved in cell wall biosynthesis